MISISPKARLGIGKVIYFSAFWLIAGLLYGILERGIMGDATSYPATNNPYEFTSSIYSLFGFGLFLGASLGSIEVFVFPNLFKGFSFGKKVLLKTIYYSVGLILLMILFSGIVNAIRLDRNILHPEVLQSIVAFFSAFAFWSIIIYSLIAIGLSLFIMELRENIGLGIFHNFLFGRYKNPIEEIRVFMFIDMKSSTSIAENLGHIKYFNFLSEYFEDISRAILETGGTVYQYAGDEIIVSWDGRKDRAKDQSLSCFTKMKSILKEKKKLYHEIYGFSPDFRAGIHLGKVTAGEIGTLKKEIIFSGDVLNTGSRILSMGKDLGSDLLISSDYAEFLGPDQKYIFEKAGEHQLRGKETVTNLFFVKNV